MAERFTGAGLAAKPTINLSANGGTVVGTTQLDGSQQINLVAGSGIILTGTSPDSITIQSTGGGGGGSVTSVTTTLSGITITNPTTTPEISGTLGVSSGGTGTTTLADGGILLGSGAGAITATVQPTDGQLLIGSTGTDPVLATLSAGSGISITEGAGTITIAATGGGGGISGTIADTQVAYGTAADTIGGDANFTWDSSRQLLEATYSTLANVYEVRADVDITKGQAVYTTGFNGGSGKPQVDLAQANSSSTMPAIGIAAADITAGQTGLVIIDGQLDGVTTSGSANDILYVSATVAGALTNVRPSGATELVQNMGNIIKVGAGGKIAVTTTGRTTDVPNSFSISGSMSADSLTLTTPLAVADGGTGATTASGARTNLGAGEPSTGSANQLNVSDGSGGWNSASLYYGTASNGQLAVGTSTPHSYTFKALAGNGSGGNVALFQTLETTASVVFQSSTSSSTNVAIKSNNNTMTLVSGGVDFAFPTADGSNGDVLTTDGSGSLSFSTPSGISGSGTAQQVTFWDGAASVTGDAAFTFNSVTTTLDLEGDLQIRDSTIVQGGTTFSAGNQGSGAAFDGIVSTDFRSCKYVVQITDATAGEYQVTEILLLNDGAGGDVVEYGNIYSGSPLGINFNSSISVGTIQPFFTINTNNAITVDFVRTLLFPA